MPDDYWSSLEPPLSFKGALARSFDCWLFVFRMPIPVYCFQRRVHVAITSRSCFASGANSITRPISHRKLMRCYKPILLILQNYHKICVTYKVKINLPGMS
ncbi:hypothetical protein TNCT_290591 [Trichonephila clavata]|uniref:Uncharacterized protein n=1 Tax=Trichonephila clavata TaxID=2740835 RepID=A0A8X6KVI8_TRICU|nr:hypothetical protein TNCT_290591 [Trichonephila clavata]